MSFPCSHLHRSNGLVLSLLPVWWISEPFLSISSCGRWREHEEETAYRRAVLRGKAMFPVAQEKAPHSTASWGKWWFQGFQRLILGAFHNLSEKRIMSKQGFKSVLSQRQKIPLLTTQKGQFSKDLLFQKSVHSFTNLFVYSFTYSFMNYLLSPALWRAPC